MNSSSYYLKAWQRLPWQPGDLSSAVIDPGIREILAAAAYVESHSFEEGHKARALGLTKQPELRQFLEVWLAEESEHGRALSFLARSNGLEPARFQPVGARQLGRRAAAISGLCLARLARLAPSAALGVGAAAEYMTRAMYLVLAERSPDPTIRRLFCDLVSQEGRHLGFFLGAAKNSHRDVGPVQLKLTRLILRRIWQPVGVDRLGLDRWLSVFGPLFSDPAFAEQMSRMDSVLDRIPVMRGLGLMHRFQARHSELLAISHRSLSDGSPTRVRAPARAGKDQEVQLSADVQKAGSPPRRGRRLSRVTTRA